MKHLLFAPAIALLAAMALVGCSDDNGGTDPRIPATSVVVDVTEQELHVGETLQLTATPMPANTTDRVQWTSDEPATATVSETGLVTAVALGSTSVKAVCGEVSATCVIRVVEPDPSELYDIISFEEEEGMTDIGGQRVTLGDIEVVGGFAAGVHSNVFWAKPYAEYGDPDGIMGLTIDLPLFTSDGNVWFGSYYCDCTGWGSQMDTWGGFVLSGNFSTSLDTYNFANQFTVWADKGANASSICAVGYVDTYSGGYAVPTMVLSSAREVGYCHLAPSAMLATYTPTAVSMDQFWFKVIVTGYLGQTEVGTVDCLLTDRGVTQSGWTKVDLSRLGQVDRLTFTIDSNDTGEWGVNAPAYFGLDEIGFPKEEQ